MRKIFIILSILISLLANSQGNQITTTVWYNAAHNTRPALLYSPNEYADSASKRFPLIVFLHGAGENGVNDGSQLNKIYGSSSAGGPAYFIAQNQWPDSFIVNGQEWKPFVLSPQAPSYSTTGAELDWMVKYMVATYRIDTNRIYFTGLSAGGDGILQNITERFVNPQYDPAASVPMSAAFQAVQKEIDTTINKNVFTWGFGSMTDVHGINTRCYVQGAFSGNCGSLTGLGSIGRFTSYNGGHCCWNTYYNPTYRENIGGTNRNVYEFMLQYSRTPSGGGGGGDENEIPIVSAGADQNITVPTSSVSLSGSASDNDGSIASVLWTKTSGGSATITTATSVSTTVTGLAIGTYVFRLTATDNEAAISFDEMTVIVNDTASSTNKTVNVNVYGSANYSNAEWNNWQTTAGLTSATLNYSTGASSGVVAVLSAQNGYSDNGGSYPVTMCPQQVGRDASWATSTRTLTLNNLNNGKVYDISLYGSRGNAGQTTRYTIGGTSVDIATHQNYTNIGTFTNIIPSSGSIVITLASVGTYNYINGFSLVEKGVSNTAPTAFAGADQLITTSSTTLTGSGDDADGSIASYLWTQVSGPSSTIVSATSSSTAITGMGVGTYTYRLTVTDNEAATGYDEVIITVNPISSGDVALIKVGVGEYFTTYLTNEGKLYGTVWGGAYGVSRDTTIAFNISNVKWTSGGQYRCIYINNNGTSDVSTTDTVGLIHKDNGAGGAMGLIKYPTDSTGARFDSISKTYVWFETYLAIRKGELYYWGKDGNSYGALQLLGSGSTYKIDKPFKLGQPGGGRLITKVTISTDQGTPQFIVLCNDGTVWTYTRGSATPVQKSGLSGVTDIGGIARHFYIATTSSTAKVWGTYTDVIGLSQPITTPQDITSTLTNAGVEFPIKEIGENYTLLAFIDNSDSLWWWGDSPQGEGGTELNPFRILSNPSFPFSWDFNRNQKLIPLTKVRGKFKNLCSSGNLAFQFYVQDLHDNWYSWGRNKAAALGNGLEVSNADTYPEWGNVVYPKSVNPLIVTWPSGGGSAFNPNDSLPPVANAGVNRDVTTAADSLYGDWSTQQEHQIATYAWTKISGSGGTIVSPSSANTAISGLSTGTYVYRITVTNTNGQSSTDDVTLYADITTSEYPILNNQIPLTPVRGRRVKF